MLTPTVLTWLSVGGLAFSGWLFFAWREQRTKTGDNELIESVGVGALRESLNHVTDLFVKVGGDSLMAKAGSKLDNPILKQFRGKTLARYQELAQLYVAASFGHNAVAEAVSQGERKLSHGLMATALNLPSLAEIASRPLIVKTVNPQFFVDHGPRRAVDAPQPPQFLPEFLLAACTDLLTKASSGLDDLRHAPAKVDARLATAVQSLANSEKRVIELAKAGANYSPFADKKSVAELKMRRIESERDGDPLGTIALCDALDAELKALDKEIARAVDLVEGLKQTQAKLTEQREWVDKIRKTQVICPWHASPNEPPCWQLVNADTNPNVGFTQCEAFITKARAALEQGDFESAVSARKEADAIWNHAASQVKSIFSAKNSVDEQVPKLQMQLSSVRGELNTMDTTPQSQEMAQLVNTTCDAIDQRLKEVLKFYSLEKFHEANALITGAQGPEQGLPISKLVDQAKSLLGLLKDAQKATAEAAERTQQVLARAHEVARQASGSVAS